MYNVEGSATNSDKNRMKRDGTLDRREGEVCDEFIANEFDEFYDGDDDDTERSFVCSADGSTVTYDVRSLKLPARDGRYNAMCVFDEWRDSFMSEIRHCRIKVAPRSVVVCKGVVIIETLERAVEVLRKGSNASAFLMNITILDDENLQLTFSDQY